MADNNKTFQELLIEQRTTNEKLSALNSDNKTIGQLLKELKDETAKPDSVSENIAGALPEILSDRRIAKQREKFDEKEEITKVDDEIRNLQEYNIMGFDDITKAIKDTLLYEQTQDKREKREKLSETSDGEIIADKLDEIEKNKELDEIGKGETSFLGGLSGALAGVSLGGLLKGIGGSLLKGGLYGLIGSVIGDELVYQLGIEEGSLRDALKSGLPLSLLGYGLAGLPGALLGLAGSGLLGIHEYITGESESLSTYDWASPLLGVGGFFAYTNRKKLAKYITKYGVIGSLAQAIKFTPFLIGAGAAIALGGAALFIAGQMEKYEQQALDRAKKLIDEEGFGDIIEESETIRTPRGVGNFGSEQTRNLKKLSESFLEKFEKGELLSEDVQDAEKLIEQIANLPKEQLGEILKDKGKRDDIFEIINNLTFLAGQQALGDAEIVKRILKLQDVVTQDIPYRDDIIDAAGQTYLERVELNAEIEQKKKELDEKMKEYGILSIQRMKRGKQSEEMKELIGMENEIKELQKEKQELDEQLNIQRIGTEGAKTSFVDIAEALGGEEKMLEYLESRNIVPLSDAMSESINQNSELLRELTELLDQNKTSVSQNIFSGGTRTNLYQKNNDVVLNKSNKPNDITFNAVSTSNYP